MDAREGDQDGSSKKANLTVKAPRARKKAQDEPLEVVARRARVSFTKAVKAQEAGDTERGKSLILTAARCILDCKMRVEAGEYAGTWAEFIAEHLEEIAEHLEDLLSFVEPASMKQRIVRAAALFLKWQEDYVNAPKHNLVVSSVYALTSYFKDIVPVMPKLGYYATMNTSGKSTAGQGVVDVGNFAPLFRDIEDVSAPAAIREADKTKKGVKLEDLHLYDRRDDIFRFMKNSFPRDGKHLRADLNDQKANVVYAIGGCPIVFTTNKVALLPPDVRRRSILLPMIRNAPRVYVVDRDEVKAALAPIEKAFSEASADWGQAGEAAEDAPAQLVRDRLKEAMPSWMNEPQIHRWRPLFAVCRALLGEVWERWLEEAARHLEGVTARASQEEKLLADIAAVREDHPGSVGIVPTTLYVKLQAKNHETWAEMSYRKLSELVNDIQDAAGSAPPKLNIQKDAAANVVGARDEWKKGDKYFPWSHFEAAQRAYGIAVDGVECAA
jgi:hypothetical protein